VDERTVRGVVTTTSHQHDIGENKQLPLYLLAVDTSRGPITLAEYAYVGDPSKVRPEKELC